MKVKIENHVSKRRETKQEHVDNIISGSFLPQLLSQCPSFSTFFYSMSCKITHYLLFPTSLTMFACYSFFIVVNLFLFIVYSSPLFISYYIQTSWILSSCHFIDVTYYRYIYIYIFIDLVYLYKQ